MTKHLELLKEIQSKYPLVIVGGSVGLYIHGVRLERFKKVDNIDLDLIVPYYQDFNNIGNLYHKEGDNIYSSSDFSEKFYINYQGLEIKVEIAIDPFTKYEFKNITEGTFKVNPLDVIWQYKLKYNKLKHKDDLKEAMQIKSSNNCSSNDIPF